MHGLEIFDSYARRCSCCGNLVIADVVAFWHKPRCPTPRHEPPISWGWFYWHATDPDATPAGPFATEEAAQVAAAQLERVTA